jgi:hypothetical protein
MDWKKTRRGYDFYPDCAIGILYQEKKPFRSLCHQGAPNKNHDGGMLKVGWLVWILISPGA